VALNDQIVTAPSPAEALKARLDDPQVAAALHNMLDHADVLALVAVALDGFLSRGEVIANTLAEAVGELRGANVTNPLAGVDVKGLLGSAKDAAPAIQTLLGQVADPRVVETVTQLTTAVADAQKNHAPAPTGALALLRSLKDPEVAAGLGFLLQVAKYFGRQLR
jgi:Protein of unknown function (DUF1641)